VPKARIGALDLFYESTGDGFPVVFCHEFASDYRGWDLQVRAFSRLYRCVTYSQRGFPPTSVPTDPDAYSQDLLIEDLRGLLQELAIQNAYLVGFSMGGSVVLNFALRYPELCRAIVVVGAGSGTTNRERFLRDTEQIATMARSQGMRGFADTYSLSPSRLAFQRKDPHGWQAFREMLAEHDPEGQALTALGVLAKRPTFYELEDRLVELRVPTLVMIGDEDEPCVEPAVFLRRKIPTSGLLVAPQTGHAVNLEEPALFNQAVLNFFHLVEGGRWATRETVTTSMLPTQTVGAGQSA
jgi:pimeloyl-ACP methyl ester carboxylesterase